MAHAQEETIRTRSGTPLHVRPAHRGDEAALAALFAHVTPEDLRFRFLSGVRQVSHDRLAAMAAANDADCESLLAFDDGGTLVAAGMLAANAAREGGEVAIAVRGDRKNLGIGWALLDLFVAHARRRGYSSIESVEHRGNGAAISLETEMGFRVRPHAEDPTLVRLSRDLRA